MPLVSSRTPEGWPDTCPVCGNEVMLEPSRPLRDAPCPHCGNLIWFSFEKFSDAELLKESSTLDYQRFVPAPQDIRQTAWNSFGLRAWCASSFLSVALIAVIDARLEWATVWLGISWLLAITFLPGLFRVVDRNSDKKTSPYLQSMICWGLGIGPLIGPPVGVLLSLPLFGARITAFQGALIGLLIISFLAAIEGLIVCLLISMAYRFWTGHKIPH